MRLDRRLIRHRLKKLVKDPRLALTYLILGPDRYRRLSRNADAEGRAKWLSQMVASSGNVRDEFHLLSYYSGALEQTYWLGVPILKSPLDCWIYQEILWEYRPDLIIETGTAEGGSALFFSSICDLVGHGRVVSIDTESRARVRHPRLTLIHGDSTAEDVLSRVAKLAEGGATRTIVVLDSDHSVGHVAKELRAYQRFVLPGGYLVVEDTNVNGHPVMPEHGPGPFEAVEMFVRQNPDFVVDRTREKFLLTYFPNGYLKRLDRRSRADPETSTES